MIQYNINLGLLDEQEPFLRIKYDRPHDIHPIYFISILQSISNLVNEKGAEISGRIEQVIYSHRIEWYKIEDGSIFVDFCAVCANFVDIYDKRKILSDFLQWLQLKIGISVDNAADRKSIQPEVARSIRNITAPVAKGYARQVNIYVIGNNNSIVVDGALAEKINPERYFYAPEISDGVENEWSAADEAENVKHRNVVKSGKIERKDDGLWLVNSRERIPLIFKRDPGFNLIDGRKYKLSGVLLKIFLVETMLVNHAERRRT